MMCYLVSTTVLHLFTLGITVYLLRGLFENFI